jgi:hypothetical protein
MKSRTAALLALIGTALQALVVAGFLIVSIAADATTPQSLVLSGVSLYSTGSMILFLHAFHRDRL